ncbi:MAG: ROK family protein [Brevinema sp.]
MKTVIGIEGGGTKFVVGLGDEQGNILESTRIPTTLPQETMSELCAYLKTKSFDAIGLGSFGPIELAKDSPQYGTILNTPKRAWKQFSLYNALKKEFSCPIIIDTDVNAALLGEIKWGAAQGLSDAVYITVGTGIGMGLWLSGKIHHGQLHSEAGHMLLPKHPEDIGAEGTCPFHGGACLEGLVAGPSIEKRYGIKAEDIADDSPIWDFIAHYLGAACVNIVYFYAPQRIILGGGVMNKSFIIPKIRKAYLKLSAGYEQKEIFANADELIVRAALKNDPGLKGAFALALEKNI